MAYLNRSLKFSMKKKEEKKKHIQVEKNEEK